MPNSASSPSIGVQRLFRLVSEPWWKRDQAVCILTGIDPVAPFPRSDDPYGKHTGEIVWLANAIPVAWQHLDADQLMTRVDHSLLIANHRFWAFPPMTPYAWLSEGLRRGIEPPWLRPFGPELERMWKASADDSFGRMQLLPLVPKYNTKNAPAKLVAFKLWEAWHFEEAHFKDKSEMIAGAQTEITSKIENVEVDAKEIRRWIDEWQRDLGGDYKSKKISPWDPLSHAGDPEILNFKKGKRRK